MASSGVMVAFSGFLLSFSSVSLVLATMVYFFSDMVGSMVNKFNRNSMILETACAKICAENNPRVFNF